ncbi:hypothetical protein DEO45_09625 [Rhodanobacter denitrificans]|uniref:Lipoprotein n=2 Tax=Rhodanobacter denitrificans TaxID=666685 RepID=A0A368KFF3_9GAMM|nr:hypothetical protein DEO45_09625 [Rhodanobacter denitrificans]
MSLRIAKVLAAAWSLSLAGCGNSDISTVKGLTLEQAPSFTVEQAFDHRKVCDSVKWREFKDDRERKIVEYRCTFKGVADFASHTVVDLTQKLNTSAQIAKSTYDGEISGDQAEVDRVNKSIAGLNATLSNDAPSVPDASIQASIDHSKSLIAVLQTGNVDQIVSTDFTDHASPISEQMSQSSNLAEAIGQYKGSVKDESLDPARATLWAQTAQRQRAAIQSSIPAAIDSLNAQIRDLQQQQQSAMQGQTGQKDYARNHLPVMQANLQTAQSALAAKVSGKSQYFASVDADLSVKLQRLNARAPTNVDEIFQWSMSDNTDPVLVFSGVAITSKSGETKQFSYQGYRTKNAVVAFVRNDATDYAHYIAETLTGQWP